ncbi:adenine-specific DNA methylase [Ligilactobacillus salitolerans]|uniref:Adenine-specific DNA methylase n=1 Tax=Ligilactobacillus salitolerans TaxID=1808352 RepID=A0A401IT11_9LACO|nr:class I SAM-dependent methyltransferase [Ligilactobacillus salitolerans]GBG94666.1 adenine-specific DNA methylase [Ligilactobacillus salitolerans]
MNLEKIKKVYEQFEQGIKLLQDDADLAYLDAFIALADDLLSGGQIEDPAGALKKQTVTKLEEIYQQIDLSVLEPEEIRQVIQLVLLQAYRQEKIQANHQMTPDSIGFLLEYLVEKLTQPTQKLKILDLTVGTGNLLTALMLRLQANGWKDLHGLGIDNDDTLLAIASIGAQFEGLNIDLYHQDAIEDLAVSAADLIISDLPVGYYPLDERVQEFKTHAKEGHSYVHHILIEQSLNVLNPGGFGLFVVPGGLFETKESQKLLQVIQDKGYLQGLLNLPAELFANKAARKSLLIIQKKGRSVHQAKQVLLGDFPSFKQQAEFGSFLNEIDTWIKNEQITFNKE